MLSVELVDVRTAFVVLSSDCKYILMHMCMSTIKYFSSTMGLNSLESEGRRVGAFQMKCY